MPKKTTINNDVKATAYDFSPDKVVDHLRVAASGSPLDTDLLSKWAIMEVENFKCLLAEKGNDEAMRYMVNFLTTYANAMVFYGGAMIANSALRAGRVKIKKSKPKPKPA